MIVITETKFVGYENGQSVQYIEGYCTSEDEKPAAATGSNLIEVDTGDWYFSDGQDWTKKLSITE